MREMKDSGVEWIGEIPQDWNVCKIKRIAEGLTDGTHGTYERTSEGCLLLSAKNVFEDGLHIGENESLISEEDYKSIISNGFPRENDVLLCCVGTIGRCTVYKEKEPIAFQRSVIFIRCNNRMLPSFLNYNLQSPSTLIQEKLSVNKSAQEGIYQGAVKELQIVLPEIKQQKRIIDYLDAKCSKIDEIIEKQLSIIEKLKEYKISIITEVVTKGLDYEVDYKESGTEWLGKIPSHWQYLSFKNVLKERNEKNFPVKTAERLSLSIDKGVTLYSEKTTNLDRFKDDVSQYKLAHEGDFVLNSMNMIVGAVGISHYFGCVSPAYYTYYDNEEDHITAKYCDYLFHSKTVKKVLHSLGKGIMSIDRGDDRINTCRLKVSRTDLRALKIPVPPICEQREIVKYLQSKENLIDKTIADRNKAIDKLQEYKKSLIYEVVTGKKEV